MEEAGRTDYRSLGEILRDARVEQGKTVEDLSEITKIVPKNIVALEADDLDQLAGPVYARGFTRTLGEALKLDVEFLLTKLSNANPAAAPPEPIHIDPILPTSTRVISDPSPAEADAKESRDETTWHIEKVRVTRVEAQRRRLSPWYIVAAVGLVAASIALYLVAGRGSGAIAPEEIGAPTQDQMATMNVGGGSSLADAIDEPEETTTPVETGPPKDDGKTAAEDDKVSEELVSPTETRRATGGSRERAGPSEAAVPVPEREAESLEAATPPPAEVVEEVRQKPQTSSPEEEVPEQAAGGLGSIVRPDSESPTKPMRTLRLSSMSEVEIWAAADGDVLKRHVLRRGGSVTLEGRDHFSLKLDDPSSVIVVLDGVRRDPPQGHSGEWIIWADEELR